MPVEEALTDLKERVKERLPPNINITELEFEGPEVVIYTDDPRAFADNGEIIKKLARELRKRIVVRPDPRVLADPELSLIHISEPTRLLSISYAVFCLKKKKKNK